MKKLSPRKIAIQNGDKFYEGKPCKHCDTTTKRTSNGNCVKCNTGKGGTERSLMQRYGITPKDWLGMYHEQGGKCKIKGCNYTSHDRYWEQSMKGLVIEHCHKTGTVRGLVCQKHNLVIGSIEDPSFSSVLDFLGLDLIPRTQGLQYAMFGLEEEFRKLSKKQKQKKAA